MNDACRNESFVRLLVRHEHQVYSYILALLPNVTNADEVMQETSIVAWRKFDQFEPGTDFVRWVCQLARYEVLQFRERCARYRLHFSDEFVQAVASEAESHAGESDVRHHALEDCLTQLKSRDREIVRLRFESGASVKSVAQRMDRTSDAIYKALKRIRVALLRCVDRRLATEGEVAHGP